MSTAPRLTPGRALVVLLAAVPLLAGLALWAFAWPNARTAPDDLPIGVAGPPAATAPVADALRTQDGAFDVHTYDNDAQARAAIENREVYGAVVMTGDGSELLTAGAASPAVAALLQEHLVPRLAEATGVDAADVPVTDVVPPPAEDPRGGAFAASVLPLALAGIASGALILALGLRGGPALAALFGAAALVGTVAALLAHSWLGVVTGGWWAVAGAFALTVLAVGATVGGLTALLGRAGIGVGALLVMLLGNPFAGAATGPELLPTPVGQLGQLLPPGAGVTLLRSVSFFDGSAAATPMLVLSTWAVLGLTAVAVAGRYNGLAKQRLAAS